MLWFNVGPSLKTVCKSKMLHFKSNNYFCVLTGMIFRQDLRDNSKFCVMILIVNTHFTREREKIALHRRSITELRFVILWVYLFIFCCRCQLEIDFKLGYAQLYLLIIVVIVITVIIYITIFHLLSMS